MKIINLGRQQGKTTRLLYASEWNQTPILFATHQMKKYAEWQAKELGLKIPEPLCVQELKDRDVGHTDVLVDEAPLVLRNLLSTFGIKEVKAITLTEKENI